MFLRVGHPTNVFEVLDGYGCTLALNNLRLNANLLIFKAKQVIVGRTSKRFLNKSKIKSKRFLNKSKIKFTWLLFKSYTNMNKNLISLKAINLFSK